MADRMGQKMDSGEADAVTEEYKRVKTKTGRFRLKTEKINADFFRPKTKTGSTAPITDVTKLIPGSAFADVEKPQQIMLPPKKEISKVEKEPKVNTKKVTKKKKSLTDAFSKIQSVLDDIGKSLKNAFSFEKETDKKKTQEEGRKKKKQKESALEKTVGAIAKIGKKILEPLKGPLDYIINWITYTFLGKVFNNLLNWMSDPGNSKKMMSIGRFLKDWWPALVGAYLIFGNSLGRFVTKLIFTIGAFSVKMLKTAIPALLNVIRTNPLAAGALLLTAGATIPMMFPDTVDEQEKKTDKAIKEKGKDKVKSELERKANNPNFFERLTGQDAEAKEQLYKTETGETKPYGFRKGGKVTTTSGTDIKGAGVDTQLIAARPGEVVINKETVNALGAPFFLSLNKKYGGSGANKPKIAKGVQTASGGGLVLPAFSSGGEVGGETPSGGTYMGARGDSLGRIYQQIAEQLGQFVPKDKKSSGNILNDIHKQLKTYNDNLYSQRKRSQSKRSSGINQGFGAAQNLANQSRTPTGSLLTDPAGAFARIMGAKTPNVSSPTMQPSEPKSNKKGFFQEIQEKITGPGSETYRDAGAIYAKQMLGGVGGPVSEKNLSKESQVELQKAIQRAKKRTGSQINSIEAKIQKLESDGASSTPNGRKALAQEKSFLRKMKSGSVRVQYEDYADEKGNMSESAKNSKNILGQFFAKERSKEQGGGYRIEDKYDFDKFKDPKTGKEVNPTDILFGKNKTVQQRLQALYLLNPLKGKGDIDMVLGGKRTNVESTQQEQQKFLNNNPGVKLYNKPQANTGKPYQSKFARPSVKIQKKQGGGVLDTLGGLGVPGTGTIMAPRSSGPRDIRGNQQTDPGFQSKFLGIPLGFPTSGDSSIFGMTRPLGPGGDVGGYTKEQKKRYASRTGSSFVPTSYAGSVSGAMGDSHLRYPGLPSLQNKKIEIPDYMMPSNTSKSQQPQSGSRSENDKLIGESFKNFGKNVQTLRDVSKKQEEMMRELGYKPDGYMNLGGRPMKKQGGGINESSGMNIPGAAADRQLIATQPGEYVLPVDAVMKMGGVHKIDQLVASLDSNSNAAKMLGTRKPIPGPPSAAGRSGMMTLPPITGGSGSSGGGGSSGRKQIPNFSATSPYTGERKNNADIYGIK